MGYSLAESTVVLTNDSLQLPYVFNAFKSIELDPGSKRTLVQGYRESPLYVARGSASPKFKLGLTDASDYALAWETCGGAALGGSTSHLSCTLLSLSSGTFDEWEVTGFILPAPGFKLGDDGYSFDLELMPTDCFLNGVSIYPQS